MDTTVKFMKHLKKIVANGDCRIDRADITGLDLVEFYAGNNRKIKDVSSMKNLKILDAE